VANDDKARTIVARLKTSDEDARTVGSYKRRNFEHPITARARVIANITSARNTDECAKHRSNIEATKTRCRHLIDI
jgi:hypothetical protein